MGDIAEDLTEVVELLDRLGPVTDWTQGFHKVHQTCEIVWRSCFDDIAEEHKEGGKRYE